MGCFLIVLLFLTARRITKAPADPLYAGATLSSHLYTIYGPRPKVGPITPEVLARLKANATRRTTSRKQLDALLSPVHTTRGPVRVGAEAIPFITNWAATPPLTGWRLDAAERLARFLPNLTAHKQRIAWEFLHDFPIAIVDPELTFFSTGLTNSDPWVQRWAAAALRRHLDSGMAWDTDDLLRVLFPLSSYATDPDVPAEKHYPYAGAVGIPPAEQLRSIIDSRDPGRDLIPLYTLELGIMSARSGAAEELARNPRHPQRAVPLLTTNLGSTNRAVIERCANALGAYGVDALPALPALQRLLEHPRERIRHAASNAIASITRSHSPAVTPGSGK